VPIFLEFCCTLDRNPGLFAKCSDVSTSSSRSKFGSKKLFRSDLQFNWRLAFLSVIKVPLLQCALEFSWTLQRQISFLTQTQIMKYSKQNDTVLCCLEFYLLGIFVSGLGLCLFSTLLHHMPSLGPIWKMHINIEQCGKHHIFLGHCD